MSTFSQKKVWHSHLKQKSPIVIRWRGIPRDADGSPRTSDYGDYNQAFFDVMGDNEEGYYYVCEDEHILEAILAVNENEWMVVTAAGGKDAQVIDIQPHDGAVVETVGQTANAPTKSQQVSYGKYSAGNILEDYTKCFGVAQEFINEFGAAGADGFNTVKELATTFYIQWARGGFKVPLEPSEVAVEPTPGQPIVVTPTPDPTAAPSAADEALVAKKLTLLPKKSGTSHDGKQLKRVTDAMVAQLAGNPTKEQVAKMSAWLDDEMRIQSNEAVEFVPEDDLPF